MGHLVTGKDPAENDTFAEARTATEDPASPAVSSSTSPKERTLLPPAYTIKADVGNANSPDANGQQTVETLKYRRDGAVLRKPKQAGSAVLQDFKELERFAQELRTMSK